MRRPNNRTAAFFALTFLLAGLTVWGQARKPGAAPPIEQEGADTGTVFRADTRIVVLHVTVVDHNGHLITNLGRDAFHVTENGQEQNVRLFKREDVPVSLGLVIDNSVRAASEYADQQRRPGKTFHREPPTL